MLFKAVDTFKVNGTLNTIISTSSSFLFKLDCLMYIILTPQQSLDIEFLRQFKSNIFHEFNKIKLNYTRKMVLLANKKKDRFSFQNDIAITGLSLYAIKITACKIEKRP